LRIIGGTHKGRVIQVPKGLPLRPTTDFAKEGLFNILANTVDIDDASVLDLFSGTGNISLEMASRGAKTVTSVDGNSKCAGFLRTVSKEMSFHQINTVKSDVFSFLKNVRARFNLIFADPPYDLENLPEIHSLIFQNKLLSPGGTLIIEHGPKTDLHLLQGFTQHRKYGHVNFSFFVAGE
jgi:16S rRNA (guanine966-N2)-methyltransferase